MLTGLAAKLLFEAVLVAVSLQCLVASSFVSFCKISLQGLVKDCGHA